MGQWNFLSSFYSMPTAAISDPPGHPVRCIENLSHLRSDQKFIAQRARMSIVRELKFAERVTRSGRDLGDQDVAEFELKAPINPNTMPVPKTAGVTMARASGWWSFAAP
jgi:hypothetical protein